MGFSKIIEQWEQGNIIASFQISRILLLYMMVESGKFSVKKAWEWSFFISIYCYFVS